VRWVDPATGAPKQLTFHRKGEAVKFRDQLVERMSRGLSTSASKLTVEQLADEWWDAYATGPTISENTRTGQFIPALKLRILPLIGRAQIGLVDRKAIDAFIAAMSRKGVQPPTIRATLNTLSSMFQRAVEWNYVATNPVHGVRRPKEDTREGIAYDPAEVMELATAMRFERDEAMVLFAAYCGLRQDEVWSLKWRDVDLGKSEVRAYRSKVSKWVSVPLLEPAWWALALWQQRTSFPERGAFVFPSEKGTSLASQQSGWLARCWRPACARAGRLHCAECAEPVDLDVVLKAAPFTKHGPKLACPSCGNAVERGRHAFTQPKFHDLRHTFGSIATAATGDIVQVAEWMGHADASMLMRRYKHQLGRSRERAVGQVNALLREWG